ncbi:MAG: signal peptidase II [Rickettsiaceae bacterium]|nr:signal peptidase II [Rickettsiaceae bacterium]MDP5082681.1 signal peptidase II [Rickettsiaceae bacterium]
MTLKKLTYYFIAILSLIAIDQASKSFLITYLKTQPNYVLELLPILDFVYAWNYGISFGLFREYHQYSNIAFLILNSLIIVYLCYLILKTQACLAQLGLILIIGGALGNLIDRILRGAVFDFIYFHHLDWAFPAFNMADSFITIGACFFIYDYLFCNKK